MNIKLSHIHLKTPDPDATAQWYVDNLGAKIVRGGKNYRMDLHGVPLNISKFQDGQTHKQFYGIEHISVETDDFEGMLAKLKANGAKIVDEYRSGNGFKCFLEGPEGVLVEVLEERKHKAVG